MTRRLLRILPVAVLLPSLAAFFGGWATITLDNLPDRVTVRQPLGLTFMVRQHGRTPLRGLNASVTARSAGRELRAVATPLPAAGRYTATLMLPEPGDWTITIHSGFGNSNLTLPPLVVVEAATATAPSPAEAERGRRLFVAKGCVTCHLHRAVEGSGQVAAGPELTDRGLAAEYLRRFLADPSIKPPQPGTTLGMPNLELKPAEIAALTAFLTMTRQASR